MLLKRIAVKISFFLNGFVYATWVSRLTRIQDQFHADNGTIGVVLFMFALGALVAMPFTGWLIIKNGSRKVSLVSLMLYCALFPFIPVMPGIFSLIALYIVMGLSTGMQDVAMNAQAVLVEREYKRPIMTSFHAFFSIGMALGASFGALFSDLQTGLFYHFIIVSGLSLLLALWVRGNLIDDKPGVADALEGPLFRMPNKALLSIGLITFCCMLGEGAISDWSVNYMENFVKSPIAVAPIALSAFATAMTLGRLFGDRFREWWGDRKLIAYGGLLAIAGLSLALLVPETYVAITGFFLVGLGLSTIVPITYSIAGNTKDLPAGVGLAMVTTVGYSAFLFSPAIIGFVADFSNLRNALVFVGLLFLVMTMLAFAQRKNTM